MANKWKIQAGQSLFEVVVAIAISALIIVTVVSLVSNSLRNATFSRNNAEASTYAQETTEWLRTQRDTDIAGFIDNVSNLNAAPSAIYCFPDLSWSTWLTDCSGSPIPGTQFIRQGVFTVTLDPVTAKTIIQADITVTWTDSQGMHVVTDSTNFTDWRQR